MASEACFVILQPETTTVMLKQILILTLVSSVDEPSRWVPGSRSYWLEDGTSLKKLDDDTFEVRQPKTILKRR